MSGKGPIRAIALLGMLLIAPASRADEMKLSLIKPGGGFLVSDGVSVVPLEIVISRSSEPIKSAKISAKHGRITATKVLSKDRVGFYYAVPKKAQELNEVFDASLTMPSGERSETFPARISPLHGPSLDVLVEPSVLESTSTDRKKVTISATAEGKSLLGLVAAAQPGSLSGFTVSVLDGALRGLGALEGAEIPPDQPSYLLFLAAASTPLGYSGKASGVAVEAPIRISVEIAPGSVLSVEGASNSPSPVTAPADGKTVIENVLLRYGTTIHAYTKKGGKKREVPIVIPTSLQPGLALAIPGQTIADGGTGATLLVAVPPSPFGGEPLWPELKIEGADIVSTTRIGPDVRALVVRRPDAPARATVLFDDQPVSTIEFTPMLGESLEIDKAYAKGNERGAFEIRVKDVFGRLTDLPPPTARIEGGKQLALTHEGTGRYRAAITMGMPGGTGENATVVAELPVPEVLGGEPMDQVRQTLSLPLHGTGTAVAATDPNTGVETARPPASRSPETNPPAKVGLGVLAGAGTTFSSLLMFGGGVMGELRLPVVEQRIAVRTGLQYSYGFKSDTIPYKPAGGGSLSQPAKARAKIAGFIVPIDLGFAVIHEDTFELLVRGGATIRFENGVLEVSDYSPGAGRRVAIGGNFTMDAAIGAGDGTLIVGATLGGIGATLNGFSSTASLILSGPLINVSANVGYVFWF
jgi:hypothetical protein